MAEQNQWNSEVPHKYVEERIAKRKAQKARLVREMRERASAAAGSGGGGAAQGNLVEFGGPLPQESLPERAPGATASLAPRPPVYVPPSRNIGRHHSGLAGIALRKTKKRKTRKTKSRKSRR
jgi:hypothetical protein